jgi:hypothetical protein
MAQIAVIAGSVGLFVAGFATWYALWHRRLASSIERVRVRVRAPEKARREGPPNA